MILGEELLKITQNAAGTRSLGKFLHVRSQRLLVKGSRDTKMQYSIQMLEQSLKNCKQHARSCMEHFVFLSSGFQFLIYKIDTIIEASS